MSSSKSAVVKNNNNATREAIISLANVGLKISNEEILRDININILKGQTISIIGKNGGGKTMLLRIISGLEKPTSGVFFAKDGIKMCYMPDIDFASLKFLPIRVEDFLLMFVSELSLTHKSYIKSIGFDHLMKTCLQNLSSGESKKLLFLSTIFQDGDVMLFDEPEQNVDIDSRKQMMHILTEDFAHVTKVIVSHDVGMVAADTDNVICLNKTIHCQGRPEAISADSIAKMLPELSSFWSIYLNASHNERNNKPHNNALHSNVLHNSVSGGNGADSCGNKSHDLNDL